MSHLQGLHVVAECGDLLVLRQVFDAVGKPMSPSRTGMRGGAVGVVQEGWRGQRAFGNCLSVSGDDVCVP